MAENINISPDMINNLVNILKNNTNSNSDSNTSNSSNHSDNSDSRGIFSNFNSNSDSGNIDMQTILKIKSIMDTMNKKDDPKSKLLYSLKPYLRKSKQAKLDQYVNLLKISEVTGLFNNKEGDKN